MDPRFSKETLGYFQLMAQSASAQDRFFDVTKMRDNLEELHQKGNAKVLETFKGTSEEKTIKTNSTDIPITIYTPVDATKDKLGVFFHGGGWVLGSRKSHQTIVNSIADATQMTWISVEYRLGPDHKYPIWLDDAADVVQYIIQNKTDYGVSETAEIGVAGDSAGGTISAALARTIKAIDFQILVYAAIDLDRQAPSYEEFKSQIYVLTPELMDWCYENAYNSREDLKDPRISPLTSTSFESIPPCLIILAELDPLRDGNLEYHKLLEKAGVKTKLVVIKGVVHGFFALPGLFPQACGETIGAIREFVSSL